MNVVTPEMNTAKYGDGTLRDARAKIDALAADRDQISLTLDVAKADRDKWFNRAKALEAALDWALDHTKGPETEPAALTTILNESRERIRSTLETGGGK